MRYGQRRFLQGYCVGVAFMILVVLAELVIFRGL